MIRALQRRSRRQSRADLWPPLSLFVATLAAIALADALVLLATCWWLA